MGKNTIGSQLYTTLIKGYGKASDLQSALALFEEMKLEGVAYDTTTYNSIIDVCVKCGDMKSAEGFLLRMSGMMSPGSEVQCDRITFSTLLEGYCQQNQLDRALDLLVFIK